MVRDMRNVLFVLLIIVPWIGCVDWSTLTEAQLAQLSPSEFLNITAAELGSIPAKVSHIRILFLILNFKFGFRKKALKHAIGTQRAK